MKSMNKQSGFTLIELLVVLIIVAVLAAVGIPLIRGNVAGARVTEADASLGTVRTAIRAAQAAGGFAIPAGGTAVIGGAGTAALNFAAGDLTGHYFEDNDYTFVTPPAGRTYCVSATGDTAAGATAATTAPQGAQVNGVSRSMDDQGTIFNSADCTGAAVN